MRYCKKEVNLQVIQPFILLVRRAKNIPAGTQGRINNGLTLIQRHDVMTLNQRRFNVDSRCCVQRGGFGVV